jgi:hypothetical protein
MKKAFTFALAFMLALTALSGSVMAGTSGDIPVGLKLFDFYEADFAENGDGEYVGSLQMKGYRIGYRYNTKQASVANSSGDVEFLEFIELAEAPSWSTYYVSTQRVAIKQTAEEQLVDFVYTGPAAPGVKTTVTVKVPALPVETRAFIDTRAFIEAFTLIPAEDVPITGFAVGGLTAPVAGEAPVDVSALSTNGDDRFEITGLRWYPADGAFAEGVTYYALITVEANDGYIFDGNYGALELMTGGRLSNIDVGFDAVVNLNEMYDFDRVPLVKKFTFQVTCP